MESLLELHNHKAFMQFEKPYSVKAAHFKFHQDVNQYSSSSALPARTPTVGIYQTIFDFHLCKSFRFQTEYDML